MSLRRSKPEQIIRMLREAEVGLSQGMQVRDICRGLGISEQTYYRWRREYGGLKVSQAKRFKEREKCRSFYQQDAFDRWIPHDIGMETTGILIPTTGIDSCDQELKITCQHLEFSKGFHEISI